MKNEIISQADRTDLRAAPAGCPAALVDRSEIATAAYLAWERDGRPEGRDVYYWCQAEAQFIATKRDSQRKTILIVDDNPDCLQFFDLVLRGAGYHIFTTCDPAEARRFAKDGHRLDLLLTDYQMPGMNGVELARCLRDQRPALPVVLVSGMPEDVINDSSFHPSFACLAKPVGIQQLLENVANMFAPVPA